MPRLDRIGPQAEAAAEAFARTPTGKELLIRWPFVARADAAQVTGDWSDRALPPKRERPPAPRLMSPRGIALRFYLTALFVAQSRSAGEKPSNTLPLDDRDAEVSWVDLVATPSKPGEGTEVSVGIRDQNLRQVHAALRRLADPEVQLVALPDGSKAVGTYEKFVLLRENGAPYAPDTEANGRYTVPRANTRYLLRLPPGLFHNGWIHVLEDSELALLLMITALHARFGHDRQVYLDGDTRLLEFGIGRDTYQAHHLLERLGLLDVEIDAQRIGFGRSRVRGFTKGAKPSPHRFRLLPDGFDRPAVATMREVVERRLGRGGGTGTAAAT